VARVVIDIYNDSSLFGWQSAGSKGSQLLLISARLSSINGFLRMERVTL
jgi:hypothetical protein